MRLLWYMAALLALWQDAVPQTGSRLVISVSNEQGVAVSSATVSLFSHGEAISSGSGRAVFDELAAGVYPVEVRCAGYAAGDTVIEVRAGEQAECVVRLRALFILPVVEVTSERPAGVTRRFGRQAIVQSGARDLAGFLRADAGLETRDDGSGSVGARIGGSNSNQVLVVVDGQPINRAGGGESDLSAVPLADIAQIEITRGSRIESGSDGIGGVINIQTLSAAEGARTSATLATGETATELRVQRGGAWRGLRGKLTYNREAGSREYAYRLMPEDGSGPLAPHVGQQFRRENNDLRRDIVLGKLESNPARRARWELGGSLDLSERGMPGYLAPDLTPLARQETRSLRLNQRTFHDAGAFDAETRLSLREDAQDFSDPSAAYTKASHDWSRAAEGEIKAQVTRASLHGRSGILAGWDRLESTQLRDGSADRTRVAAWAEVSAARSLGGPIPILPRAGARLERVGAVNLFGPKVGINGGVARVMTFDLQWGRSYRTPEFYALFWADDLVASGNPDLQSEESEEWIASLSGGLTIAGHLKWSVTTSDQQVAQMIMWRQGFDGRWKPVNLAAASVRTLDLTVEHSLISDRLSWRGGVDWTEARNRSEDRTTTGKYLSLRAPRSARCGLRGLWDGVQAAVNYRWVDRRPATESNSKWLAAYELVDARVGYTWNVRHTQLGTAIGAENLLNRDFRIVRFAPMPLREFYLELSITELAGGK
ncbi:TonB-dependent receptor [candidate division KSB1 bacterium]|nr:TonB-dependent receptor [candidate division KSB1 bacterium]